MNFWSQIAFAFGGLELGAILGGEIRNPARNVPRAAWISGSCIAAFYILGTLSLMVLMPPDRISILTGLVQASTEAGARLHFAWLGPAMIVLILTGVAGQLCAWIGGTARIPFVIGLDRYFRRLSRDCTRAGARRILPSHAGHRLHRFGDRLQAGEGLRVGYRVTGRYDGNGLFIPFLYMSPRPGGMDVSERREGSGRDRSS